MDAELKAKWVAALRSGKYKQGTLQLHDRHKDTHCCLGVLRAVSDGLISTHGGTAYNEIEAVLGHPISPYVNMNDDWGCTFEQIADYIETGKDIYADV